MDHRELPITTHSRKATALKRNIPIVTSPRTNPPKTTRASPTLDTRCSHGTIHSHTSTTRIIFTLRNHQTTQLSTIKRRRDTRRLLNPVWSTRTRLATMANTRSKTATFAAPQCHTRHVTGVMRTVASMCNQDMDNLTRFIRCLVQVLVGGHIILMTRCPCMAMT